MKQTGARGSGLTSSQVLILVAMMLLLFTTYVTIQTHTTRFGRRGSHIIQDGWLAHPGDARVFTSSSSNKPAGLRVVVNRQDTLNHADSSDKANGGGHPLMMAPEAFAAPAPQYLAFIGVFSAISSKGLLRRQTLRNSWFPPTKAALEDFEKKEKVKLRFVLGKTIDGKIPEEVLEEEETFGGHLHYDVIEEYDNLKLKMLKFFRDTLSLYQAKFYIKVDDDIFFRPDRVPLAAAQWRDRGGDFMGCFRKGGTMFSDPKSRYFEPQRFLVNGEKYFLYTSGPAMALSYEAVLLLTAIPEGGLRFFGAGDASVAGWFLGLNVTHLEDHRFCDHECKANTIAYYDTTKCNGLCDPAKRLPELMNEQCGSEPTIPRGSSELPWPQIAVFDASKERCAKLHRDSLDQSACRRKP